jgi:pyruvate kinase
MLHSMINNPIPTRAETSDVANAILDGADVVMLSGESAIGLHPVETVATMGRIALEVEGSMLFKPLDEVVHDRIPYAISKAVTGIIDSIDIEKIVVLTKTGYTARLISNFRIQRDIIAITDDASVKRRLNLVYGVIPLLHSHFSQRDRAKKIAKYLVGKALLRKRDTILYTAGVHTRGPSTNMIEIHRVGDLLL